MHSGGGRLPGLGRELGEKRYGAGEVYGTKEFAERVYKSNRQVVNKSKW